VLPPRTTYGRNRAIALLLLSLLVALLLQYLVSPAIVDAPASIGYIKTAWTSDCLNLDPSSTSASLDLEYVCVGNNAVFRPSFTSAAFYLLAAAASKVRGAANHEFWALKVLLVLGTFVGTIFIPNTPLFNHVFLNVARVGSPFFIIIQYLVLVKMTRSLRDRWAARAERAICEGRGTGRRWRATYAFSCVVLYTLVAAVYALLFKDFSGCAINNAFVLSSAILSLFITIALATSDDGCVLTGGVVCFWTVFLVFFAVSSNPNAECNPRLGASGLATVIVGLLFTFVSISWTGWSYHAETHLLNFEASVSPTSEGHEGSHTQDSASHIADKTTQTASTSERDLESQSCQTSPMPTTNPDTATGDRTNTWHINLILATVVFWKAMVLTRWGVIAANGRVSNPEAGVAAMWIIMCTTWICTVVYLFRLVESQLFPRKLSADS
jgi:Serine incorporator (Serinc)